MASRSLAELLLRPSTFTRIPPHAQRIIPSAQRIPPSWTSYRRALSNTTQPSAQPALQPNKESYISESEAQQPQQDQYTPEHAAAASPQPPPPPPPAPQARPFSLDDLFSGVPKDRTPPSYMPQGSLPPNPQAANTRTFGAKWANDQRRRPKLDFDSMTDLPDTDSIMNPTLANKPSSAASLAVQQEETFAQYPRLNPTYGRSVELDVKRGRDIVRGIGMLGSLVARNKVRKDSNAQRYHERGGLKRKRLASERWRARFKKGFKALTGRVTELTKKGW
ncbi:ribosomal s21 [Pyrenophora seminiperda CCB06]|uniref:Ribosomal s21 n=1 Tax=Pyrenophora seminiperda CCB06 TaxID=1302712 RepID=A0A3M7MG78_9PLEO|nr:ribosomal s21 [Pyrenophora seminiperda CCB06]